ncbi:MAG: TolC family protein [Bacteroidales bacterium]|nr:TolC family protein [Bacteroidales bacterium]
MENDVYKAYYAYIYASEQALGYNKGLLTIAEDVLKGKIYSYERGEAGLLEVLDAWRTYDDLQEQFIETIYTQNVAWVNLQRAIGQ